MAKPLSVFLLILLFSFPAFCQVKDIIDRDIFLIKYVPDDVYLQKDWQKIRKQNSEYRKKDPQYHEILLLDTLAIPYLVDKVGDTTATSIRIPCSTHNLTIGDIAFALLNDIIPIPMHYVTGSQWDVFSCDTLPTGTWDYLHDDRNRFQNELRRFFASSKGKTWVRLFKGKVKKKEYKKIIRELPAA